MLRKSGKTTQLTFSIIALAFSLVILVSAVFAWFVLSIQTDRLTLRIAKIDSHLHLYKANDINYNGIPDYVLDEETGLYHYSYTSLGYRDAVQTGVYTASASEDFNLNVTGFMPSQIHTYKLKITNNSESYNILSFVFENAALPEEGGQLQDDFNILNALSVRIGIIDGDNFSLGEKFYLTSKLISGGGVYSLPEEGIELFTNVRIEGVTYAIDNSNIMDFVMQIEFESYDNLSRELGEQNPFASLEDYQALAQSSVSLRLIVYMEIK